MPTPSISDQREWDAVRFVRKVFRCLRQVMTTIISALAFVKLELLTTRDELSTRKQS